MRAILFLDASDMTYTESCMVISQGNVSRYRLTNLTKWERQAKSLAMTRLKNKDTRALRVSVDRDGHVTAGRIVEWSQVLKDAQKAAGNTTREATTGSPGIKGFQQAAWASTEAVRCRRLEAQRLIQRVTQYLASL